MLINEILSKKVDYTVTRASDERFIAKAEIGGRNITFEAEKPYGEDDDVWEVEFSERGDHLQFGKTFKKTGSGNQLEVFAMVKDCMSEFIERYKPTKIEFTAEKDGDNDNRANLYKKLLDKFNTHGYKVETARGQGVIGKFMKFSLTRTD